MLVKFPDELSYTNALISYTKSMAAWSCFGYIIGLGDRHLGNILINKKTGAVEHIDFDVIFESGKILQVNETVPFRLTNNFQVAFGVSSMNSLYL
jgi:phosphatidylinositol kinase/protein kinase (PI-3  family)